LTSDLQDSSIQACLVPSWSWSYGSWIYNYLCNQCLSPLKFWVRTPFMARCGVLNTTLCDKVCQWLATDRWFFPDTPVSSTNKTFVYILLLEIQLWGGEGWYPINQFNPVTFLCLLEAKTWISMVFVMFNVLMWEVIVCWYWWNCWSSLSKCSFYYYSQTCFSDHLY